MKKCGYIVLLGMCLLNVLVSKAKSETLPLKDIQHILDSAYFYVVDNPNKTIVLLDSIINMLDDSYAERAIALQYRCMAKKQKAEYEGSIVDCLESLRLEEENENLLNQINLLNLLGNIYRFQRKYDEAVQYYVKSLKIGEISYPKSQEIGDTYNGLACVFSARKKFEDAQTYFKKAESIRNTGAAISEEKINIERLAATYQDIGGMYLRMDSLDAALRHYEKSIELNKTIDNQYSLGKIYDGIGSTYLKKKAYKKAIQYYEKSLESKEKSSDKRGVAVTATNLCELLCEQKRYEDAMSYCDKSIEYGKDLKYYKVLENTMSVLYKVAKVKGDNKEALDHYENYIAYKDSLNNKKKDIEIQKIISQYKIEKEKAEAEKLEIVEQQKTQQRQNMLTTGMLSALIMSLGLFFYSRSKKKLHEEEKKRRLQEEQLRKETEGRRIEEQKLYKQVVKTLEKDAEINAVNAEINAKLQERTKVASALHDSVCSGLVSARMHFESVKNNITPEDEAVFVRGFGLLNEAYEICREISHDLSPPMLAKFGLAPAIEDLCEKLSTPQTQLQFNATPFEERLDHQQELTLYQSIQELLQNILKHSSAAEAHVQLTDYGDSLNILVEDDGKGFDTAAIADGGIGLQRISTRVKHLGGSMDVDSTPGNGTTVIIDVPKLLTSENGSIS